LEFGEGEMTGEMTGEIFLSYGRFRGGVNGLSEDNELIVSTLSLFDFILLSVATTVRIEAVEEFDETLIGVGLRDIMDQYIRL
jgi:hypothetical protein